MAPQILIRTAASHPGDLLRLRAGGLGSERVCLRKTPSRVRFGTAARPFRVSQSIQIMEQSILMVTLS